MFLTVHGGMDTLRRERHDCRRIRLRTCPEDGGSFELLEIGVKEAGIRHRIFGLRSCFSVAAVELGFPACLLV